MNAIYKEKIRAFLELKSIAVLGYSTDKNQPANAIYKKLVMEVIPGGCPIMFVQPDLIHRCMGWFKKLAEKLCLIQKK